MDARRPCHLGQTRQRLLHIPLRDHHQVCQFVNHNHNIRQFLTFGDIRRILCVLGCETFHGVTRIRVRSLLGRQVDLALSAARLVDDAVVGFDSLYTQLTDDFIPPFHFFHGPPQDLGGFFGIDHDRVQEMRDAFIGGKLQPLRVDHQKFDLIGRSLEQDAADHGVETDALSGSRGSGDQQVRHADQIGDHRTAYDVLPQSDGKFQRRLQETFVVQDVQQVHRFTGKVGDFDADGSFSRDRGNDPDAGRPERQRQVVRQIRDFVYLDTRGRFQLVHGDHGARFHLRHLSIHTEIGQFGFQNSGVGDQAFTLHPQIFTLDLIEKDQRRNDEVAALRDEVKLGLRHFCGSYFFRFRLGEVDDRVGFCSFLCLREDFLVLQAIYQAGEVFRASNPGRQDAVFQLAHE